MSKELFKPYPSSISFDSVPRLFLSKHQLVVNVGFSYMKSFWIQFFCAFIQFASNISHPSSNLDIYRVAFCFQTFSNCFSCDC